jgi:L-2,4-diaminobutyrate decarboxylase
MAMGHQVSPPLPAAVWAEVVIAALNQSVAVSEMSPSGTAVEGAVIRWMAELAGFGPRAGGHADVGRHGGHVRALLAARSRAIPNVWTAGVGAEPPVIVCGEHAHYAVSRAAGEMGIGLRHVVAVPSRDYRMDAEALERTLADLEASGRAVLAVVATAGSTATGAFDDLAAAADACERRGHWLHVDGAHGASALLSPAHRARLRGLARAHSLAWDPHKMLLLPLAAGVVLVREERWLEAAFAQKAPYLFHPSRRPGQAPSDELERSWDQGLRSFQCSRRSTRSRCGWRSSATAPTGWARSTTTCARRRRGCTSGSRRTARSSRCTRPSRTSCASAGRARRGPAPRRSTRCSTRCGRATTARAPGG